MDPKDFAAKVQSLADEMTAASSRWTARVNKLRRDLERAQRKLQQIQVEHKRQLDALWDAFRSDELGAEASAEPSPSATTRKKRGSLDAPLLQLIREHFQDSDFTVHDVIAAWNSRYPSDNISISTIRGVLNRHVMAGLLREAEKGGWGHGNLDRFALEVEALTSSGGTAAELAH